MFAQFENLTLTLTFVVLFLDDFILLFGTKQSGERERQQYCQKLAFSFNMIVMIINIFACMQ
jgi:hypothetical protein